MQNKCGKVKFDGLGKQHTKFIMLMSSLVWVFAKKLFKIFKSNPIFASYLRAEIILCVLGKKFGFNG